MQKKSQLRVGATMPRKLMLNFIKRQQKMVQELKICFKLLQTDFILEI